MLEIFKDEAGEWRYRLKGRQGEPMFTSEGYTRKADARRGLNDARGLLNSQPPIRVVVVE